MAQTFRPLKKGWEKKLLEKPPSELCKEKTLRAIAKSSKPAAPRIPTKSILVQAVFEKNVSSSRERRASQNTVTSDGLTVWETIKGMQWTNAMKLWLRVDRFLELARISALSQTSEKLLAFMIVLRRCPDEPELLSALYDSCDKIVRGKRLTPQFLKVFEFAIYGRDELYQLKSVMSDDCALFKKVKLDPERDKLAVIYSERCALFDKVRSWRKEDGMQENVSSTNQEGLEESV